MQIGIAALGEGTQQVEGGGGLAVGLYHALRIGFARGRVEVEAVDDVAAVGRQGTSVLRFGVRGAGLGKLAGEAAELDDRAAGAKGQHHRHLQQHLEHVADVVRMKFGKALGAVATLQQEGLAGRHRGEALLQPPRLAGKDQRWKPLQRFFDASERRLVRISGNLPDRQTAPAVGRPCHAPPPKLEAASPSATFRISESMKRESRLKGGGFGKNSRTQS